MLATKADVAGTKTDIARFERRLTTKLYVVFAAVVVLLPVLDFLIGP